MERTIVERIDQSGTNGAKWIEIDQMDHNGQNGIKPSGSELNVIDRSGPKWTDVD